MSFHSPLPTPSAGSSAKDGHSRRVSCDLPARLDVLPEEVDLIEMWLGGLIADLSGGGGAATFSPDSEQEKEMK
jgi:hypothetical protein